MTKIIILSGISGSGKTTWTKNKIQTSTNIVSISRDKIRELLFGYTESNVSEYYSLPNLKQNEKLVSTFQITNIRQAIAQGFDIILDNTHLDKRYIDDMLQEFPQCDFEFVLIDTNIDTAIRQDMNRIRFVGENVIRKQHNQLQKLKHNFDFKPIVSKLVKYVPNDFLPNCIICDLDGTLADYHATRPAYGFDANLIALDKVIEPVLNAINGFIRYNRNGIIIFLSGRTDNYYDETAEWLFRNTDLYSFNYKLFMRSSNDFRKDSIIKMEIFDREIRDKFNVLYAIDDRNSIVNLWQSLDIFVLNVNQTGKEF